MAGGGGGGDAVTKDSNIFKKILLLWTPSGSNLFKNWLNGWMVEPIVFAIFGFVVLFIVAAVNDPGAIVGTFAVIVGLSPIWLPISLLVMFWVTWMHYIRYQFWFKQQHVLLEVQLPPEVTKSPLAMELFLTAMWNAGGESTFIARIWQGGFRPIWTLEIASIEGQVRFYMHIRKGFKNVIEARLYGQYPEAKITEVEDYTATIPFNLQEYDLWGTEFKKSEPGAVPIRTYVDYALDKNPDTPEIQVDPITNTLELLSSIGKDEYYWLQIVMKARKKDEWYGFYHEGLFSKKDTWTEPAEKKIKEITEAAIKRAQGLTKDEDEQKKIGARGAMLLNEGEKRQIEAIERSLSKNVFECGVRVVYLAKKDKFNGINIGQIVRFFDAYRYPGGYNSLGVTRGLEYFNYPWQDWGNIRKNKEKRNMWFRYKHRAYFYVPYDQVPVFLTTEELATLWHFPSSAVKTPSLDRVSSRRSEAPPNLPTGPANLPV